MPGYVPRLPLGTLYKTGNFRGDRVHDACRTGDQRKGRGAGLTCAAAHDQVYTFIFNDGKNII